MSIEEFYEQNKRKYSLKLINEWLNKGYIRGAKKINNLWYIPNEALPPYTKHGNPKGMSIYKSIVKGVVNRYDVFGKLYGLSDLKFDVYIEQLLKEGFLCMYESEGIKYYNSTLKSRTILNMNSSKLIELFGLLVENKFYK